MDELQLQQQIDSALATIVTGDLSTIEGQEDLCSNLLSSTYTPVGRLVAPERAKLAKGAVTRAAKADIKSYGRTPEYSNFKETVIRVIRNMDEKLPEVAEALRDGGVVIVTREIAMIVWGKAYVPYLIEHGLMRHLPTLLTHSGTAGPNSVFQAVGHKAKDILKAVNQLIDDSRLILTEWRALETEGALMDKLADLVADHEALVAEMPEARYEILDEGSNRMEFQIYQIAQALRDGKVPLLGPAAKQEPEAGLEHEDNDGQEPEPKPEEK